MTKLTLPRSTFVVAALLVVATLAVSVAISTLRPPVPRVHDEFSYLLAGDTFAQGRLSNPTHPMWRHFETVHVIQQPSYASKYPPGQGAMLAIGQRLASWPIAGVWITSALAVVACYWMLLGMVPRKWAAIGAATLIIQPGIQLTWGQTYWGGTLAFAGGALVLGAAARLSKPTGVLRYGDAIAMACGALVLAVTRPFEGMIVCLLVAAWVVVRWTKQGWPDFRQLAKRVVLPQCAVVALGAAGLMLYNQAVTGSPLKMPYQVHEQTYGMCPLFLFGEPVAARDYLHDSIRKFHADWSMDWFNTQQSMYGLAETKWRSLYYAIVVLAPFPLLAPIVAIPWWKGRNLRGPLVLLATVWLVTQMTIWNWPHYIAPIAPVLLLVVVYGMRNLRVATRQWDWSRGAVPFLIAAQAIVFVGSANYWINEPTDGWQYKKAAMQRRLEQQPGTHLVLVEYAAEHHPHEEWVYNEANLNGAKVLWAHSMSPTENAELVEYFGDRQVWRLEADATAPTLSRYDATAADLQFAGASGSR